MNYVDFEVGEQTYKLRLTTQNVIAMEKALGCNPIQIIYNIDKDILPKLSDLCIMLQSMLSTYQHGITVNETMKIIDNYMADGHNMFDLIPVLLEVFTASGFINTESEEVADPN